MSFRPYITDGSNIAYIDTFGAKVLSSIGSSIKFDNTAFTGAGYADMHLARRKPGLQEITMTLRFTALTTSTTVTARTTIENQIAKFERSLALRNILYMESGFSYVTALTSVSAMVWTDDETACTRTYTFEGYKRGALVTYTGSLRNSTSIACESAVPKTAVRITLTHSYGTGSDISAAQYFYLQVGSLHYYFPVFKMVNSAKVIIGGLTSAEMQLSMTVGTATKYTAKDFVWTDFPYMGPGETAITASRSAFMAGYVDSSGSRVNFTTTNYPWTSTAIEYYPILL